MLLKVSDAAEQVGVSKTVIYRAIRRGVLKPVDGVPYVCLRSEDVEAFAARERPKGGRPTKPVEPRRPRGRPRKVTTTGEAQA
jgi:excisionase family DNA binding protein